MVIPLFPSPFSSPFQAQLTAAALTQQMATSQFAGQKRPTEEQVKTDPFLVDFNAFKETPTETKKDKTDDITERIRQLEEKYEKLQNSSRKLAESVVSGELSKEEAKSLLDKMEE